MLKLVLGMAVSCRKIALFFQKEGRIRLFYGIGKHKTFSYTTENRRLELLLKAIFMLAIG